MIFAQTGKYARKRHGFTVDDKQGAAVAHADFLRAIIQYSSVETVQLFSDIYASSKSPAWDSAYQDLLQEFPGRKIEMRTAQELRELLKQDRYLFYSSGVFIRPLAQLRISEATRFPICTLTHSVDIPLLLLFIPGAALLCEGSDALIASSEAGHKTLESLLEAAEDLLAWRFGKQKFQRPRIAKIPLGVDTGFLKPLDKQYCREVLGLPEKAKVLLYLGRFSEELKADLEPLLVAFKRMRAEYDDFVLVFAGHDADAPGIGRKLRSSPNGGGMR